jgi:6-phosphogluconolactonase
MKRVSYSSLCVIVLLACLGRDASFSEIVAFSPPPATWTRTVSQQWRQTTHGSAGCLYRSTTGSAVRASSSSSLESSPLAAKKTPVDQVVVLKDADVVGREIRRIVVECAQRAIAERGHFALAIPGGSILKMLVGMDNSNNESDDDIDWTSKTTIAYVNHKCVAMDDAALATQAKAKKLFLDSWSKECNVIVLDGTDNGQEEAKSYQAKLRALSSTVLPRSSEASASGANGLPVFDLALIGVGDDGHIGSLYPNRDEVLVDERGPWVLPVAMKSPPSITLSLPVMQNAKRVVVAACGVSEKYPQGKSAGMRRAICVEQETLQTFPAVGLRSVATWVMDAAAASKLDPEYISK